MNRVKNMEKRFRFLGITIFSASKKISKQTFPDVEKVEQPVVETVAEAQSGDVEPLQLIMNSMFLTECYEYLTQTEEESLHYVTGTIWDGQRNLERIIPLELSFQSVAGARAADHSIADKLIELHDYGLLPLAIFHSHPGYGAEATHPSATDIATQTAIERGEAKIVGGIFSRDGYVRFYSCDFPFRLQVVGKRIERIEDNVFKIEFDQEV